MSVSVRVCADCLRVFEDCVREAEVGPRYLSEYPGLRGNLTRRQAETNKKRSQISLTPFGDRTSPLSKLEDRPGISRASVGQGNGRGARIFWRWWEGGGRRAPTPDEPS